MARSPARGSGEPAMTLPLQELARRIQGGLLNNDTQTVVNRVAPLDEAIPGDLSFLPDPPALAIC
jgi:UDP-3-O-[3-hydroxymyristoyl] glucosamine N-acyltransferase